MRRLRLEMDADAQLRAFAERFLPEVAAAGLDAIARLSARFPAANRLVYDNYNALAVGFASDEKSSHAVFSIAFFPRWVSLFLLQQADFPDPEGLLEGAGTRSRHIKLAQAADVDRPAVLALLTLANERAVLPIPNGAGGLTIIKSISAKQKPRRPSGM